MLVDLIVRHGTIHTVDPERPLAHSFAVWNGSIVGFDEDIAGLEASEVIDLAGRTVVPGFVDAHTHLGWTGMRAFSLDVYTESTVEGVLDRIRARAAGAAPEEWIEVTGYDQRRIGGTHLTAAQLDDAGGGRPVWVKHFTGHAAVVSSAVLDAVDDARSATGRAAEGLLVEDDQELASKQVYPVPIAQIERAILVAGEACLRDGVTSCVDAGIGAGLASISAIELRAYQNLARAGTLPLRVRLMPYHEVLHPLAGRAEDEAAVGIDLGMTTGFGGERLALGPVKFWFDGGMMARTAAFTEPYEGTENTGLLAGDPQELVERVAAAHGSGFDVAIHAIGDRAIDLAIQALRIANERCPRPDARPRIEHGAVIRDDQLGALAELNVTVVSQPCFLWTSGDDFAAITGPERTRRLYRGRSLLDAGIRLAGSTDRPHEGSPLRAVQVLAERRSDTGQELAPTERITAEEALRISTIDAAWAAGMDDIVGSLAVGKRADFVVLGDDPLRVPAHRIGDIDVHATYIEGNRVWGRS